MMFAGVFRFSFREHVPIEDAEMTLHLAMLAAEGLFGKPRVAMEFRYELHSFESFIDINGDSEVSVAVARIYAGLLLREFGDSSFRIANIPLRDCQMCEVAA
jgi:hypothetical protein